MVALRAADRCWADQRLLKGGELLYQHISKFSSFRQPFANFLFLSEEEASECVLSKSGDTFICSSKEGKKSRDGREGDDVESENVFMHGQRREWETNRKRTAGREEMEGKRKIF